MNITAEDIIALLPIVADRGWRVYEDGAIRSARIACPLCELAYEADSSFWGFYAVRPAAEALSIPIWHAKTVADAADHPRHPLRPLMLAALGIKERA